MRFLSKLFGSSGSDKPRTGALEAEWDDIEMVGRLTNCKRRNIRNKHYIYGLYNHGTGRMFYFGRTNNPHRRWKEHVDSANPHGTPKERYIARMLSTNRAPFDIPAMIILEACTPQEVEMREVFWQRKYQNIDMTNVKVS